MEKVREADDSFKYRLMKDKDDQVLGAVWQTTVMHAALTRYGEIVNFDFRKARSNDLNWTYGSFVVINGNRQFIPASESFYITEDLQSYTFMINTTMDFTPSLNPISVILGYSDGFLNQVAVWKAIFSFIHITLLLPRMVRISGLKSLGQKYGLRLLSS